MSIPAMPLSGAPPVAKAVGKIVPMIVEDRINHRTETFEVETDDPQALARDIGEILDEQPPDDTEYRISAIFRDGVLTVRLDGSNSELARSLMTDLLVADGRAAP